MFHVIEKLRLAACVAATWALSLLAAPALAQVPQPPVLLAPGDPGPSTFPLSFNDPRYANNIVMGATSGSVTNATITASGTEASIRCGSPCTIRNTRVSSREAVRIVKGGVTIEGSWLEAQGISGDHADVLQCYGGGGQDNRLTNTTVRAYSSNATAGFFAADDCAGSHYFENVLFWGGPFGLRVNSDGANGGGVYLKNVYFVQGSFGYSPFRIEVPILQWENVRWATIQNGQLVEGATIPRP